jgi:hypothetical protein
MIVYGIKWKCEGPFQETDNEGLKLVQLDKVLFKLYKEISKWNLLWLHIQVLFPTTAQSNFVYVL